MDAQPNHGGRRRRRRKKSPQKANQKVAPAEPVLIAARRPDSPRLEKPTRRMKAASAKPRSLRGASFQEHGLSDGTVAGATEPALKKRRQARIVQRSTEQIDEVERSRLRLLSRLMASEGRAAITRAVDEYLAQGFELPAEQDVQLKLLEHFDEAKARQAIKQLAELIQSEAPRQLPLFRQRLRRLEDHADDVVTREAAAELRRSLPA